jgi:hypothetical protein
LNMKELTSESLRLPASLFLLWAGAGRLVQLEGALLPSGVDRCLRSVSKIDLPEEEDPGVCGGPVEDLRLLGKYTVESSLDSSLDDWWWPLSRSPVRPRPGRSASSSI